MGAYQFCNGCAHASETFKDHSCPAQFNPYDTDNCPRNARFIELQTVERIGRTKKGKR